MCVYIHHDFHSYVHVAKIILFLYPSNRSNKKQLLFLVNQGEEHTVVESIMQLDHEALGFSDFAHVIKLTVATYR